MNDTFEDFLDQFVVIYLDDILIYSQDPTQHPHHVHLVLERLRQHGLYAKLEKCEFHQQEVQFLGFHILVLCIDMDPRKVDTLLNWQPAQTLRDRQSFLGFANFYQWFIDGYS